MVLMDLIKETIRTIVSKNLNGMNITDHDSLFETGIDSMNMLFVLNEIENALDVEIPDDELLISNFENIEKISELIYELKGSNE